MAKNDNGNDAANSGGRNERLVTSQEDQVKAGKWFQRAKELGEKRQFDYAIEYYVNGLEFWPDQVEGACKPLHGCAVARRQTGGKKPGLKDTMKRSMNDKDPKRAFLNALWLFGHDPDNLGYIEGVTKNANRLHAADAAKWSAGIYLKALETASKVNARQFQALVQLLEEMGDRAAARNEAPFAVEVYRMGVETLNLWRRRIPKDETIDVAVKNLSTKLTITKGKYEKDESYRESIADTEMQKDLHDQKRSIQAEDRVGELVAKAEAEYRENPDNEAALKNLIDLLCRQENETHESKAVKLLKDHYQRTNVYRWKQSADDIAMKQLSRTGRTLEKAGDREAYKQHRIKQLRFELDVFKERVEQYPTDNRIRFEYGVRNFQAGRFDEAIPLFQAARNDPKNRAVCGVYLGRCFYRKGYHTQAITALEAAIKDHPYNDDDLAKSMLYWLGRSQQDSGDAKAALETYGKILQLDYNYIDVRGRLDALKK